MKLTGERRLLNVAFCVFLLLEGGVTAPERMPSADCGSFAQSSKCDITAVNDLSHVNYNYLLAIIGVVLAVFPMLFCCSKGEKESSPESPQISKEPVHVYDEIDDSVRELNKTSQKAEVKDLKIKKESEPEKYDRYQSDIEIQKKKLESSKQQQASASALQDPEAPELPNREYLTDIDFVAQEFDLLLRRAPELPNRTEDSTNTMSLMSTDVTTDDKAIDSEWVKNTTKKHNHGTQQFLLQQELERSVGMTPKSALPRKHNVIKGSNSKAVSGSSQSHKQREKMARNFPGEIKAARDPESGFKHCASSARQPQLLLVQKQRGMKPLPYRQPIRAEQVLQPVSGSQNMDTSPMYQNVTEEEPTYDDTVTVNYLNVTGDVQQREMTYQNILSKKRQQIREEVATYQPLIFHSASADTEEDEYMEMDNMM